MHSLARPVQEPASLVVARKTCGNDWNKLTPAQRSDIRASLLGMQQHRCAYCESLVQENNGHIEHFRKRNFFPTLTFDWDNLFYSCMSKTSCGKHKDTVCSILQYDKLIDPCKDNPEDFFIVSFDGKLVPRIGLSNDMLEKAVETIRIFGLNDAYLVRARYEICRRYQWLLHEGVLGEDMQQILNHIKEHEPFPTAIFHYLGMRMVE